MTRETVPYAGKLAPYAEALNRLVQGGMRIEEAIRVLNLSACTMTARRAIESARGSERTEPPLIPDLPSRWVGAPLKIEMLPFARPELRTAFRAHGIPSMAEMGLPLDARRAERLAPFRPETARLVRKLRWLDVELAGAARQAEEPTNLHDLLARAIVVGLRADPRATAIAIVAGALNDRGVGTAEMSRVLDCTPLQFHHLRRKAAFKVGRALRYNDGHHWVWAASRAMYSTERERRADPFFRGMTRFGLEAFRAGYWEVAGVQRSCEHDAPVRVCCPAPWPEEEAACLYAYFGLARPATIPEWIRRKMAAGRTAIS